MAIEFIFVGIVLAYSLLLFAFIIKDYIIMLLASMAILCVGIYIAIYHIETIDNLFPQSLALISICLGMYILINSSIEKIEELM